MSSFSYFLAEKVLAHIFEGELYTPPEEIYISLHTEVLNKAGIGAEVSGASYQRKPISFHSKMNLEVILWTNLPQTTIVAIGLWDQDDNFLMRGTMPDPIYRNAGDSFSLSAGDIIVGLD